MPIHYVTSRIYILVVGLLYKSLVTFYNLIVKLAIKVSIFATLITLPVPNIKFDWYHKQIYSFFCINNAKRDSFVTCFINYRSTKTSPSYY